MFSSSSFSSSSISSVPVELFVRASGYDSKGGYHYDYEPSCRFLSSFRPFQDWLIRTYNAYGNGFKSVRVLGIYPFAHTVVETSPGINSLEPKPIGFAFVDADISYNGKKVPGAVFLRGDSVAILPILRASEDMAQEFVLTTTQPRVPVGAIAYKELPAGMMDGKKNFAGTAASEMEEETHLVFSQEELEPLGTMDPSVGGCDERIRLFRGVKVLPMAQIQEFQGKLTGVIEDGEVITVQVWKMADFVKACASSEITDAKAKCLLFHHLMYEIRKAVGSS